MTGVSIQFVTRAGGDAKYEPQRAPESLGFGPHEVHPQRIKKVVGRQVRFVHNGDWLLLLPGGMQTSEGGELQCFAITPKMGGRETAERLAAFRNAGMPTRVVNLAGATSTSKHTRESVEAELSAKGLTLPSGP